jgi:oligoendopeptidase F
MPDPLLSASSSTAVLALLTMALCAVAYPQAQGLPASDSLNGGLPGGEVEASSWALTDLYPTDKAWEESLQQAFQRTEELTRYKGTLGKSSDSMLTALLAVSDARREASRLSAYASLKADADLRVGVNQERKQRARTLFTAINENTAWLSPEILLVGPKRVADFRARNRILDQRFGFFLSDTLRAAPHTLGTEAEKLVAATHTVLTQPLNTYGVLADAEFPVPTIVLADGTRARLDGSGYEKYRAVSDRRDRKAVFDAYWGAWKTLEGTAGTLLVTSIMGDRFLSHSRKFPDDLQAVLFKDNLPDAVYRTLISETNSALPTFHRYLRVRKVLLGITDDLRYYDNYPPILTPAHPPRFTIEESERITLAALEPLGQEYEELLRAGFAGRWMDAEPRQGKWSGTYMNPMAYDVHPYVLLNHNDDYDSLTLLAHEWGHAVHTLLADRAQPFDKAFYSGFIAETASIANEMLVSDYLVAHAGDRQQKLYFLSEALESIRTTFFRQAMFGEFELALHKELEQGRVPSGQRISELYCGLLRKYYGEAEGVMKIDPAYCVEWAFVPHFYHSFYVYQYATSMAGAASITDEILSQGASARDRFLTMLRAGGSDYPYALYRQADIDLATPAPYRALVARMDRLLDQIETLVKAGSAAQAR